MNFRDKMQWKMVDAIRNSLADCGHATVVAATGAGKTETVRKIKSKLKDGTKLLFIAPRINNVTDAAERYDAAINIGSLGLNEIGQITCTTKQSIHKINTSDFDVVVFDEFHNYKEDFIESINAKFKIFLSATPWNDNGFIWDQFKNIPKPCFNFSLKDGIDNNVLCDFEIFGSSHAYEVSQYLKGKGDYTKTQLREILAQDKLTSQVKEIINVTNLYKRKKVAILCANIEHAEKVQIEIMRHDVGCLVVHSKLKCSHKVIEEFKNNDVKFICSVAMMQEGTDIPPIDCVVYLRPIKSSRVMIQSVGRGLRISPGKEKCLILDYGHVFESCGLPHNPIIPSEVKSEKSEPSPIRQCEQCYFIFERAENGSTCPNCGHVHKVERDVEKNLKKSLLENEFHFLEITKQDIYKFGRSKNGVPFMTLKVDDKFHTLFAYQYKAVLGALKSGKVRITYTKEGKFRFKFIKVESVQHLQQI